MNIFAVSRHPARCAKALDDIRVNKMVLETAQMVCTVLNLQAGSQVTPYRNSHATNRLTKWAQDPVNLQWLWHLGDALGNEVMHRTGRRHASHLVIQGLAFNWPQLYSKDKYPYLDEEDFFNAASHRKLGLDYTDLPTFEGYKAYLNERWRLQSITPRKSGKIVPPKWTNRKPPVWCEL